MPRIPAAQRREDFVRAAVAVIAAHGVDGATTRRIAEQAKAPLASLHYCFNSKEQLFGAVYEELSRVLREEVLIAEKGSKGELDAAAALLRRIMTWYMNESDFSAAAVELILWARRQQGDIARKVYDEAFEVMNEVLRQAGDRPAGDAALEDIAPMIAALSDGFVLNWLTFGDKAAAVKDIELAVDVLKAWAKPRFAVATKRRKAS